MIRFLPTNASFEGMVKADYVNGRIELEQLEEEIAELLAGRFPRRLIGGMPSAGMGTRGELR